MASDAAESFVWNLKYSPAESFSKWRKLRGGKGE